jgi:hypothetical protein
MTTRHPNRQKGTKAAQLVASEYDLEVDEQTAEWFDAVNPRTGSKYEVKSTKARIGDDYPNDGRFRLWEDQHRSLLASDAAGTAWYVFVLFDDNGGVEDMRRMRPSTVSALVPTWNQSGHQDRQSRQYKLPWPEVME